jgi:hypothetical protein
MRSVWTIAVVTLCGVSAAMAAEAALAAEKIPIVYSTDLFHPHADPDDHYDLACLFAIEEFDVRGVILDLGQRQTAQCGRPAVEQMMRISGRKVPYAVGLGRALRRLDDKAEDEPAPYQGAVRMILDVLQRSPQKVVLFSTGSCRDIAVALNRRPDLMRAKVRAVYFNIGRGPNEPQEECNVGYDPLSYYRLFQSGLPLYWCPCYGRDGYETLYEADQTRVVGACAPRAQNYFVYCLTRSTADPIEFLSRPAQPLPTGPRAMWCTAPMFHAADRKIYRRGDGDYVALSARNAARQGLEGREVAAFQFVAMRASLEKPRPPAPPPAKSGAVSAAFLDRTSDRVGTGRMAPDGVADCHVRLSGVSPDRPIQNIVITGPNQGRWEYVETNRWWRLAFDRNGDRLDAYFQFYAVGEHAIELVYADGSSQKASLVVPSPDPVVLNVALDPKQPNGFVFRSTDRDYKKIMASCLQNLLSGLGR